MGKTKINQTFGNGFYDLFMVVVGMVYDFFTHIVCCLAMSVVSFGRKSRKISILIDRVDAKKRDLAIEFIYIFGELWMGCLVGLFS